MPAPYTYKKLGEVEDSAPKFGMEELQEARFANDALDAERTGVSLHRLRSGKRQAFGHRHDQAEEVYVVLSGTGRVKLDAEIVELEPLDALRVAPGVMRQFEAGENGLEWLAFGARHDGDGEIVPGWWNGGS
jgi:mannose-6-phosphate isomerase-like protein (cupin superfamily)